MAKRNARRGGRLFAGRKDEAYLTWLRTFPCAICLWLGEVQQSRTEVEHWQARSAGGYDNGDTYPTCQKHRILRHEHPEEFRMAVQLVKLDLDVLCRRLALQYEKDEWPCP
jgi:hypothetical protein